MYSNSIYIDRIMWTFTKSNKDKRSVKIKSNNKIYNIVGALVLSNSCWAITDEQNLYVRIAMLNKMMCAVLKKLQNFRRVMCKFLLGKFRQCEDYSEQSKPYFEPYDLCLAKMFTSTWLFWLCLSTFSLSICTYCLVTFSF